MAQIKALIIDTDETVKTVQIETSLEAYQSVVGGYIEALFMGDHTVYLNEEGLLLGLPPNDRLMDALDTHHDLVGTALIVGPADADGDDTDVPDHIIKHYELEN